MLSAADRPQQDLGEGVGVDGRVGVGVRVEVGEHRVDGALVGDGHDSCVERPKRAFLLAAFEELLLGLVCRFVGVVVEAWCSVGSAGVMNDLIERSQLAGVGLSQSGGVAHGGCEDLGNLGVEVDRGGDLRPQEVEGCERGLLDQGVFVGEVVRDQSFGNAGGLGNTRQRRVLVAVAREHLEAAVDDLRAPLVFAEPLTAPLDERWKVLWHFP